MVRGGCSLSGAGLLPFFFAFATVATAGSTTGPSAACDGLCSREERAASDSSDEMTLLQTDVRRQQASLGSAPLAKEGKANATKMETDAKSKDKWAGESVEAFANQGGIGHAKAKAKAKAKDVAATLDDAVEEVKVQTKDKDTVIPIDPRAAWAAYNDEPNSVDPLTNTSNPHPRKKKHAEQVAPLPSSSKVEMDNSRERSQRSLSAILLALGVSGFMCAVLVAIVTDVHARQEARRLHETPVIERLENADDDDAFDDAIEGPTDKKSEKGLPIIKPPNSRRTARGG